MTICVKSPVIKFFTAPFTAKALKLDTNSIIEKRSFRAGDRSVKLKKILARLACYREDLVLDVEQDIPVIKAVIHNDYGTGGWSDIALLEIAEPVKFNNYIGPVALPQQNSVPSRPKQCMAIGWGDTGTDDGPRPINEVNVEVFSTEQCSAFHDAGDYSTKNGWLKNRVLCASAKQGDNYQSVCSGDSGGPMFCGETVDGKPVQVLYGIASFVFGCVSKAPAGFTNVSSLMDWLTSATANIKQQKVTACVEFRVAGNSFHQKITKVRLFTPGIFFMCKMITSIEFPVVEGGSNKKSRKYACLRPGYFFVK
uniref:Peptidase S1 domain-containing protein n=1 Tax=Romanomermis culicivorax TaxID=13658 RepID=A0A915JXA4_ROMCU